MNFKAYRKLVSLYENLKLKVNYKITKNEIEGPIFDFVKEAVKNAILNHYRVYMYYIGDKENVPGSRWVEVYVWGLSKFTGNNLIRVYQYKGTSTTITEGFKTFRMDRIRSTAVLTAKPFTKPQPLYNPDGDGLMDSIFYQAEFKQQ